MSFVETADCETDGYLSSSGLQDPLEAGSLNAPATPPTTHADSPTANGFPVPALRFPSVSGLYKELVIQVERAGGRRREGGLSGLYETPFTDITQFNTVLTDSFICSWKVTPDNKYTKYTKHLGVNEKKLKTCKLTDF